MQVLPGVHGKCEVGTVYQVAYAGQSITACCGPHWDYCLDRETPNGKYTFDRRRHTALVFIIIAASAPLTVLAGGIPTNYAVPDFSGCRKPILAW